MADYSKAPPTVTLDPISGPMGGTQGSVTNQPGEMASTRAVNARIRIGPPRSKYQAAPKIFFEVNKPLPYSDEYNKHCALYKYLELSCTGGHKYKNGMDADGVPIFREHQGDDPKKSETRKAHSPFLGFCKPIIKKFNDFVFTSTITRDKSEAFKNWAVDVDLYGTSFHEYMRSAAECAQKFGLYFIIIDSTKADQYQSEAQVKANGDQMFLVGIHPDRLINWTKYGTQYSEMAIIFPEEDVVRYYTTDLVQVIHYMTDPKTGECKITVIEEARPHGYPSMPVVKVNCDDDDKTMISEIADNQKTVFNSASVLMEEIFLQTFTSWAVCGSQLGQALGDNNPDPANPTFGYKHIGARRFTFFSGEKVTIEKLSGDPGQAQSIRDTMKLFIQEIYRHAGLHNTDVKSGNVESGKALQIKFNDVGTIARGLADHFESAENRLLKLWSFAMNVPVEESCYEDDFNDDTLSTELENVIKLLEANIPQAAKSVVPATIKKVAIRSLAPKLAKLKEGEDEEIDKEADELYEPEEEAETPEGATQEELSLDDPDGTAPVHGTVKTADGYRPIFRVKKTPVATK